MASDNHPYRVGNRPWAKLTKGDMEQMLDKLGVPYTLGEHNGQPERIYRRKDIDQACEKYGIHKKRSDQ